MTSPLSNRLVWIDEAGEPTCITIHGGIAKIPAEFGETLTAMCDDLALAEECVALFGGVPIPVAKAILRHMDLARAVLGLIVNNAATTAEGKVH